jgi:hypothetical protein
MPWHRCREQAKPCIGAENKPCIGAENKPCIGAENKPCIGTENKPCIGAKCMVFAQRRHRQIGLIYEVQDFCRGLIELAKNAMWQGEHAALPYSRNVGAACCALLIFHNPNGMLGVIRFQD